MALFCVGVHMHVCMLAHRVVVVVVGGGGDSGSGGGDSSDDNDKFVCLEFCAAGSRLFKMLCFNNTFRFSHKNVVVLEVH